MSQHENDNEKSLLLDHDYDGIQELDHPLPRWWIWSFYLTIVFGVVYAGYYMTVGPTLADELKISMREIEAKQPKQVAQPSAQSASDLLAIIKDKLKQSEGRTVFMGKCAACHGQNAEGSIGPNLTDNFWLHGKGQPQDIAKTIREGVTEKGMPPWGAILKDDELYSVVAFIHSIHGSQPAGAKPPQGQEYKEL